MTHEEREDAVQLMHMAKAFSQPIAERYLSAASQKLYKKWEDSESTDDRERAYLEALALKEFRKFIRDVIIRGEMIEREWNEKEEKEREALTQGSANKN